MTHDAKINSDHEFLHRTQSEDSPKSPKDMSYVRPLSGYMMTTAEIHSRTSSRQQSQLEISGDNSFYSKPTMHESCSQDNFMISTRRGSHTLANEPIFIGRNELEQMRIQHGSAINPTYEFETHSLPRRTCIHHKQEEYHTHSLPRREHHHHYLEHSANSNNANNVTVEQILEKRRLSSASIQQDIQHSYVNVNSVAADTYSLSRRSSSSHQQQVPSLAINMPLQQQISHHHHQALQQVPPNDELCSTCSSETEESESQSGEEEDENDNEECEENYDGVQDEDEPVDSQEEEDDDEGSDEEPTEEEREIFIDFKPNISATSSHENLTLSTKKKKKLIKAMSEGEILLDNNEMDKQKLISASDDDIKQQQQQKQLKDYTENLLYNTTPIRDEDVFKALSTSKHQAANNSTATPSSTSLNRYNRETFRKRSVSLEDPLAENEVVKKASKNLKPDGSTPASPGDGRSFASSDDITRGDQSEGNWNDSQITVLPLPPLPVP